MPKTLATLLTADRLRAMAGDAAFQRGRTYAKEGAVESLERGTTEIEAKVRGAELYEVGIHVEDGDLVTTCDCPAAMDAPTCKHAVAAGLVALGEGAVSAPAGGPRPRRGRRKADPALEDLAARLRTVEPERLVQELVAAAKDDRELRERLQLRYGGERPGTPDFDAYARRIDQVTGGRKFIDYREARAYARAVDAVITEIGALLREGHAGAVIDLCERMLRRLGPFSGRIDDSDGHITRLRDRTEAIHLAACEAARPDPVALARNLHTWHMTSEIEIFNGAVERYAKVLGPEGLAEYRRLAEPPWKALPPSKGLGLEGGRAWAKRFRITRSMEALARACGDLEELIRVQAGDLSHEHSYRQVVQTLRDAGQEARAIDWAERAMAAFPEAGGGEIGAFLMDHYQATGRHDQALEIEWRVFAGRPGIPPYEALRERAERAGQVDRWRERALAYLQDVVDEKVAPPARRGSGGPPVEWYRGVLAGILLQEGDVEGAWKAATSGPCDMEVRTQVAILRAATHPMEVVPVLEEAVEAALAMRTREGDFAAIGILHQIRTLCRKGRCPERFLAYVARLRLAHGAHRRFLGLLAHEERDGWRGLEGPER